MNVEYSIKHQIEGISEALKTVEADCQKQVSRGTLSAAQMDFKIGSLRAAYNSLLRIYRLPANFTETIKQVGNGNLTN
ncbi:MAG: hypothetical protein HRU28_00115 [Rhizobiales bacterium]|nr:hypothetical protein [Hyphomicrobiales bacterium]